MLRELFVEHFKCFEQLSLPLGQLTLLSGVNAAGKSTILQALALLHQSAVDAPLSGSILLDGSSVRLGTMADVVNKFHGDRSFRVGLAGSGFSAKWRFGDPETKNSDAIAVPIYSLQWEVDGETTSYTTDDIYRALLPMTLTVESAEALRLALGRLDHIGAERLGPRETYDLGPKSSHDTVGIRGERAPGTLWYFGEEEVTPALRLADATKTLRAQVQAWLDHFFPGVEIQCNPVLNANAVTLGFRTTNETGFHRPQHVGYGITHVLPLLVAGLRSTPGRVLVVENPEAHLHPAGQAAMGVFLSRVAAQGATVVVETHSDHILNGVRRAVRDTLIVPDEVVIHFFRERSLAMRQNIAQVVSPKLDEHGNIDHWPRGFFDQFDRDMSYLAGLEE